jgi:hypothetical protein
MIQNNEKSKKKFDLSDIFKKNTFFIHFSFNEDEIKRYLIAYNGKLENKYNDNVNYVIVDKFENRKDLNIYKNSKLITSAFIWKSINDDKLNTSNDFFIK